MTNEQISISNSKKLDHLLWIMDGDENNPGAMRRLAQVTETLYGIHGDGGIVQKVNTMYRIHTFLWCTFSGGCGVAGTLMIQKLMKFL